MSMKESLVESAFLNMLIASYQIIGVEEETDFHISSNGCGGGGGGGTVKNESSCS